MSYVVKEVKVERSSSSADRSRPADEATSGVVTVDLVENEEPECGPSGSGVSTAEQPRQRPLMGRSTSVDQQGGRGSVAAGDAQPGTKTDTKKWLDDPNQDNAPKQSEDAAPSAS